MTTGNPAPIPQKLPANLLGASFARYFEEYRPTIEAAHGKPPHQWPPVWNFSRVIRNAFSHGGSIHFDSPNAHPVAWKGLTYGPADEGRPVLFNDMGPADVIVLMEEMDSKL